jgi:hypothetical protein
MIEVAQLASVTAANATAIATRLIGRSSKPVATLADKATADFSSGNSFSVDVFR